MRCGPHPLLVALAVGGLLLALVEVLRFPGFLHSVPPRTYNALALMPVWLGLTLLACRAPPGAAPRAGRTLAAAALVASAGLGFCYQAVAWTWTSTHAATLAEARTALAGLLAEGPGPVAVPRQRRRAPGQHLGRLRLRDLPQGALSAARMYHPCAPAGA